MGRQPRVRKRVQRCRHKSHAKLVTKAYRVSPTTIDKAHGDWERRGQKNGARCRLFGNSRFFFVCFVAIVHGEKKEACFMGIGDA